MNRTRWLFWIGFPVTLWLLSWFVGIRLCLEVMAGGFVVFILWAVVDSWLAGRRLRRLHDESEAKKR
jgi:hypothetical protein